MKSPNALLSTLYRVFYSFIKWKVCSSITRLLQTYRMLKSVLWIKLSTINEYRNNYINKT